MAKGGHHLIRGWWLNLNRSPSNSQQSLCQTCQPAQCHDMYPSCSLTMVRHLLLAKFDPLQICCVSSLPPSALRHDFEVPGDEYRLIINMPTAVLPRQLRCSNFSGTSLKALPAYQMCRNHQSHRTLLEALRYTAIVPTDPSIQQPGAQTCVHAFWPGRGSGHHDDMPWPLRLLDAKLRAR